MGPLSRGGNAPSYQLDLVTPGSRPSRARSRKQMRHIAKRRIYPRGRPQIEQRLCCWTGNFAGRAALAILDFFATCFDLS
jgi:hypothetical protein